MTLTPVELRHVRFGRRPLGYSRSAVDRVLVEFVSSFEDVWRERGELADKVEQLEADLARHRELEELLRTTLVSAERAGQELKEQARREADLIVSEAHNQARAIVHDALAKRERLRAETHRIRALMRSALEIASPEDDAESSQPEAA